MKILILTNRDRTHPWAGGSHTYTHEVASRWVKQGDEVTMVCGTYPGSLPCKREDEVDGIKVIRRGGMYTVFPGAVWQYLTRLGKEEFDVVLEVMDGIPFFTPLFVFKPKITLVHHIHTEIFRWQLPPHLARIAIFVERVLSPLFYRKARFITVSGSSREEMIRHGFPGENIEIAYNGIRHNICKPDRSRKASYPYVVYVGRLRRYKRVELLIEAMAKVVREIPEARLFIVGHHVYEALKELVVDLGLQGVVKFHGFVSDEEKVDILQRAHVAVQPSVSEGWGLTVIEANACGTPAIASDIPGLRDAVQDGVTGLLFRPDDVDDLAEKIMLVLKHEELRNRLADQAIEWAQRFDWDRTAEQVRALLCEVIEREEGKVDIRDAGRAPASQKNSHLGKEE